MKIGTTVRILNCHYRGMVGEVTQCLGDTILVFLRKYRSGHRVDIPATVRVNLVDLEVV